MPAYYNEIDPFAAAWLRELIKAGEIAPGDVDERDIKEVKADDLKGYTQCHFFAGIGCWSYALRLAGWPDDRPVWTGSCPCPSFSAAGKGAGFDDPRHLWPAWFELIRECRPATLFGEQVDDSIGFGWLDLVQSDLEAQAYSVGKAVLGACSVGAPHIRQRLYFCAGSDRGRASAEAGNHRQTGEEAIRGARSNNRADLSLRSGSTGLCADAECGTAERRRLNMDGTAGDVEGATSQRERVWLDAGNGGDSRLGANARRPRRETRIESKRASERSGPESDSESGGGSDPGGAGLPQRTGERGVHCETMGRDQREAINSTGATRGFWRDCDWWYGRDGKYRPIESGLFPLAHGSAKRVGRLRGYGNAIVPQVAEAFVRAYMELDR